MDLINVKYYKVFLALSIIFIPIILRAWEVNYLHSRDHHPYAVVELDDGDVVFTNTEVLDDTVTSTFLIRLSPNGSIKDVIDFTDFYSGKNLYLLELKLLYGHLFWAGAVKDSSNHYSTVLIKMDQNLNVLKDTIYQGKQFWTTHLFEYDTDKILAAFTEFNGNTETRGYWIVNKDFSISTVWIDSSRTWANRNLGKCDYNKIDNKLYVSSSYHDVMSYELPSFNKVDTFFNVDVHMWSSPLSIQNGNTIVPCLKRFLQSQPPWGIISDLFLISLDTNMHVVDTFQFHDDIEHRVGEINAVVQAGNYIYYGSTKNISTSSFIKVDTVHSSFHLIKLDQNLNMIWSKSLKSDVSYQLFAIHPTSDGGVIMVGQRWDWVSNPNQDSLSLYIVKLDSNGVSTDVSEINLSNIEFKIYPNPSSHQIRIDMGNSYKENQFELIVNSISGHQVSKTKFSNYLDLDISRWENGSYIFTLMSGNQITQQKFIKH
jgi:hypothetical protein